MVYLPILSVVGFDNHHHLLPLFNLLKNTECTYLAAAYPFNCYYCTKKRCLFLGKASISYFFYLHVQLFDNTAFLWNVTKNLALKSRNNQFFSVTLFGQIRLVQAIYVIKHQNKLDCNYFCKIVNFYVCSIPKIMFFELQNLIFHALVITSGYFDVLFLRVSNKWRPPGIEIIAVQLFCVILNYKLSSSTCIHNSFSF